VADEEASLFYTPGDAADLATKVNFLLEQGERRREMGQAGQRRVSERFEWRTLTAEIARLCEEYVRTSR
jgi:glycosyltransferase involved in cell wall biosynthesis